MLRFFLLATAALLPLAAHAAPRYLPDRDLTASYSVTAPGRAPQTYQLDYNAGQKLARITSPVLGIYFLADLPAGQAHIVVPALHAIVDAPDLAGLTQIISSADNARFSPVGQRSYIGLSCENYLVTNAQGAGTVCLTPQGVVLHFSGHDAHGSAEVTAQSVTFTPQPVDEFAPPAGYAPLTLPANAVAAMLNPQ